MRRLPGEADLEAAALLRPRLPPPPGIRIVARFGDVVTCRLRVADVPAVRAHPSVRSLKAARPVEPADAAFEAGGGPRSSRSRAVPGATGRGVLAAFLDWGCDFAAPSFRREDGRTRLVALWDQRAAPEPGDPAARFGYGRVLDRARIDAALAAPDPYGHLGYHPGPLGSAHGTHVMDIAAGNGRIPGGEAGVAPEADLLFVHLASGLSPGPGDLGDSVRLLEALDFVRTFAGDRPWVANLSLGRTGGSKNGRSLVERAMDALLEEAPGRAVVQSAGNYRDKRMHAEGLLAPGGRATLPWEIGEGDPTPNELEVWYPARDRLRLEIVPPSGRPGLALALGESAPVVVEGREVGWAYHRARDPLAGDNHVDVFLEATAPPGTWEVRLEGADVVDGRFHAWIERDSAASFTQSRFAPEVASPRATVGTIATGHRTLVVGAFDPRSPGREPAASSSQGPTRDGRLKPDLLAPGIGIEAARSTPAGLPAGSGGLVRMSGTSMAAPHVAGTVAALFGAAGRRLRVGETRRLVLGSVDPALGEPTRTGHGILNVEAALAAVRRLAGEREQVMSNANGSVDPRTREIEERLEREMAEVLGPASAWEVVGRPGSPVASGVRAGDVVVRFEPAAPLAPQIGRVLAGELHAEAEGYYARTAPALLALRASPVLRRVFDPLGLVPANQVVLRPRPGPASPPVLRAPVPRAVPPPSAPPAPYAPAGGGASPAPALPGPGPEPEPGVEEPEPGGEEPGAECQRGATDQEQVAWWEVGLPEREDDPAPEELRPLLRYLRVSWPTFAPREGRYFAALGEHLRRAGAAAGPVDRSSFRAAVRAFQTAHRMDPDGIPGEDVLFELQREWAERRDLDVVRVEADRVPGTEGFEAFRLRSDVVDRYQALRREVRDLGGVVTSAGSFRELTAEVTPGRSPTSMHYSGLALDLATRTGMQDPEADPYVVVREGRKWRVFCRSRSAPERELEAVVWRGGEVSVVPVRANVIDFTEIAERHGFASIGPRSSFPGNYLSAEWWHFQCESALVPWVSQFGIELLGLRRYDEAFLARQGAIWENRKRIFQRGRNGWW
jgi:hypothetical protein